MRTAAARALVSSSGTASASRAVARRPMSSTTAMACRQCEQREGDGCSVVGVCGKTPTTSALQDLLIHALKGLSAVAVAARDAGATLEELKPVLQFVPGALFTTLTNVNFDAGAFPPLIHEAASKRELAANLVSKYGGKMPQSPAARFVPPKGAGVAELEKIAAADQHIGIEGAQARIGADRAGVLELIVLGVKGACAYGEHTRMLDALDAETSAGLVRLLAFTAVEDQPLDAMVATALKVGELNLKITQLLEDAHKAKFGAMSPTQVATHARAGKCILVSGHDMRDLEALLVATEGKGINVFTHGEMLPGNAYPKLKKHKHLAGHFGSAWQNQKLEFAAFPGAILMTSNCIIQPAKSYKDRIFTTGPVGWPGVTHVSHDNFAPVIAAAQASKGFAADEKPRAPLTIGYGKDTLVGAADAIVDAVKAGAVKHFFFIGGCDGTEGERNYFAELAQQLPQSTVILTAGCAKFRFNRLLEGQKIGPFPRVLDVGQCNDISGAIAVAGALAGKLNTTVDKLPLSFAVSWLEQKAVSQLLTCLHLGLKGIKLGPRLPAFITPNVLKVLVDNFQLAPTTTPGVDFPGLVNSK